MNRLASLSSLLVSMVTENASEPKNVIVPAMVAFLTESFPEITQSDAQAVAIKAFEVAHFKIVGYGK